MHYLITGHTGFKGAWLSLLLQEQGHQVSGLALAPEKKSIYEVAALGHLYKHDLRVDIRNHAELARAIEIVQPDVVIHLAAQALVRESYRIPRETFETNVMGTVNVLQAVSSGQPPLATLIITTDKVYRNVNKLEGYVEEDALGGHDPYSSSKAAADLAAQSWISTFPKFVAAIARAGNVVGAGDWSTDRLMPDLVNAGLQGSPVVLRYPNAIRPWQHVLDCLSGYEAIVAALLKGAGTGQWNIGPKIETDKTVSLVAEKVTQKLGSTAGWVLDSSTQPHEAGYLLLDSTKIHQTLGWKEKLNFDETLEWTVEGYRRITQGNSTESVLRSQIQAYLAK